MHSSSKSSASRKVKLFLSLTKPYAMRAYGEKGVDIYTHIFVTSVLVGIEHQLHALATLSLGKEPSEPVVLEAEGP
jgi:hypothetical protein